MKASQPKRRQWVYISLIVMLFALISFSILPLITSIIQINQSQAKINSASGGGIVQGDVQRLESEALGYQLVLERESDNQNALRGLLEVRLRQGNLPEAITVLERLAQLNPQEADYTILLAQGKQQIKDYEGAAAAYERILANQPGEIKALKGMVDLLLVQNRSQEAIDFVQNTLTQAVKGQSTAATGVNLTSLQLLLGEIFVQEKRYPEAIAVYDQAIKSTPEDFRPLLGKALLLKGQGKTTEAEVLFKEAISLAPVAYKDQIKSLVVSQQPSTILEKKE